MNISISISLFKRTGLSEPEVDLMKNGLEDRIKALSQTVAKTQRDIDFWKAELKKQTPTKKCTKCRGAIDVWPFNNSVGYYIKGYRVRHVECPVTEKK